MLWNRLKSRFQPMFEADGVGTGVITGGQSTAAAVPGAAQMAQPGGQQNQASAPPAFDYEKLAQVVSGKQSVTEDTILKSFFKQQGLSQEEMVQAIASFKTEKAKNQPDINALQQQVQQAAASAQQALIEKDATLAALTLGIDTKTIPYVLKLADLSNVVGQDGKTNAETLQNALKKVLEDVPALKSTDVQQAAGFQVGASGGSGTQQVAEDALKAAFGL